MEKNLENLLVDLVENRLASDEWEYKRENLQGSPIFHYFTFVVTRLSHARIWVFKVIVWIFNSSKKQQKTLDW
jgi:hypothetical protein